MMRSVIKNFHKKPLVERLNQVNRLFYASFNQYFILLADRRKAFYIKLVF